MPIIVIPIIVVLEDEFSGGKELAQKLAEDLGFRLITDEILYQNATARGADGDVVWAILKKKITIADQLTHRTRIQLCILEAALAEQVRSGGVVCYGTGSELLELKAPYVVRIRVHASFASRVRAVEEVLKLPRAEAERYLKELDRRTRRWRAYLASEGRYSGSADLEVNLDNVRAESVSRILEARMADVSVGPDVAYAAIENLALSTRVRAELALHPETAHLEIAVRADHGGVALQGKVRTLDEISELRHIILQVPEITHLDMTQVQLASSDLTIGTTSVLPHRFRLAWSVGAIAVLLAFLGFLRIHRSGGQPALPAATEVLQAFSGIVTDSKCARLHHTTKDAECVRACVKQPRVKYALYDGNNTYVLSDQQDGDRLAAKHVVVRGSVNQQTGVLDVAAIEVADR
jgi:hypothetical protein